MVRPITLVQPRHSYAPPPSEERFGDRVLPNTLLHVRARLMEAGVTTDFIDHNVEPERQPETDVVGLTVLGMPYIPIVRSMARKLLSEGHEVIIGGQTVEGLVSRDRDTNDITDRQQFDAFFGEDALVGNDTKALSTTVGIDPAVFGTTRNERLERWKKTSLVPAYESLSEADLRFYLNGLIPFEIAQGCEKACTFCSAAKNRPEAYRDTEIFERDLTWLLDTAEGLQIDSLNMYLTNLDLFQTGRALSKFADSVIRITKERQSVRLRMRGLCTVDYFHALHTEHPDVLHKIKAAGLERVGAGVDGWSYDVWRSIGKTHNDETKCIEFIEESGETYGIQPEALMVYGHEKDTAVTMEQANEFLRWASGEHNATPRPHCDKDLVPGNVYWADAVRKNDPRLLFLHTHPEYCQAFDFCAAPSSLTHPDRAREEMIDRYFREGCAIGDTLTQLIEPMDPTLSFEENMERMLRNLRKYDV